MKIKNNKLLFFFAFFLLFLLWVYSINLGSILFETVYRDNTIYFPVDYNYQNLKENPFSQVQYDWGWSNARWFGALLESFFTFKKINTLQDLQNSKIIGIFINCLAAIIFFYFAHKINQDVFLNLVVSLGIFSLPAFLYWNFMGGFNQQFTLILVMVLGYSLCKTNNKILILFLYLVSFLCLSSYSPLIFFILIYPSYILLFDRYDKYNKKLIFKKFFFFIIISCFSFLIFKTFFVETLYNFFHKDLLQIYPYIENTHPNYNTNTDFTSQAIILIFFKIFLFITLWFKSDLNLWNIYMSWLPLIILIIILFFMKRKNNIEFFKVSNDENDFSIRFIKKNILNIKYKQVMYVFILYLLPVLAWLPLGSTLVVYRATVSTAAILYLFYIYILCEVAFPNFKKFLLFFLLLLSFSLSFHSSYQNAKNANIEFKFVKNKLSNEENEINHIHIVQPEVGYGYNGYPSINEEFNRPSMLTWQENSRYINSAIKEINKVNYIPHDCYTKVYDLDGYKFPIYKVAFPTKWDLNYCINNLKDNWVLVTFSHPHKYVNDGINNHSHLKRRSRYQDLTFGLDIKALKNYELEKTLIIDLNEIQPKKEMIKKSIGVVPKIRSLLF